MSGGMDRLVVQASPQLARTLREAGPVDRLRLLLQPMVAGAGPELFGAGEQLEGLTLQSVRSMPSGAAALDYAFPGRQRETSPTRGGRSEGRMMSLMRRAGAFAAGVLVANSAPHLATAVSGRIHLTPLAGKESSPRINLVWGLANALGGLALTRACTRTAERRWDQSLIAFEAGAATFALWMAASEAVLRVNTPARARR